MVSNYAQLVPDLAFEIRSKSDSLEKLRQKIQSFLELGTQVGVLVDPRTRTMEVYRLDTPRPKGARIPSSTRKRKPSCLLSLRRRFHEQYLNWISAP